MKPTVFVALSAFALVTPASGQAPVPVTVDNFIRAESDLYMGNAVKEAGSAGKLFHHREPIQIDKQLVIRPNRDTLYSAGVFDLDAGPATITLPDAGNRFMSLMVLNEDHYVQNVFYGPGSHTVDKDKIGTRYVLIGIRTLVDPADPNDVKQVHTLQDGIATYLAVTPTKNDGATLYKLNVPGNVPVDGFWSISLYNGEGYFQKNEYNAYSLNNITARKGADGSVAIQFGGCDGKIENCLPIMKGWNYTVRLYRPRAEILNGAWKFPEAQAAN